VLAQPILLIGFTIQVFEIWFSLLRQESPYIRSLNSYGEEYRFRGKEP
jgi:hypothetical protein